MPLAPQAPMQQQLPQLQQLQRQQQQVPQQMSRQPSQLAVAQMHQQQLPQQVAQGSTSGSSAAILGDLKSLQDLNFQASEQQNGAGLNMLHQWLFCSNSWRFEKSAGPQLSGIRTTKWCRPKHAPRGTAVSGAKWRKRRSTSSMTGFNDCV